MIMLLLIHPELHGVLSMSWEMPDNETLFCWPDTDTDTGIFGTIFPTIFRLYINILNTYCTVRWSGFRRRKKCYKFYSTYVETNWRRTPIPKLRVLVSQGLLFSNFIFCDCSLMYKEGFCKLFGKILFFKVPVIKQKFFAARATHARLKLLIFWNWSPKNIHTWSTEMCTFRNSKKC